MTLKEKNFALGKEGDFDVHQKGDTKGNVFNIP